MPKNQQFENREHLRLYFLFHFIIVILQCNNIMIWELLKPKVFLLNKMS
jgi:hypothetical protein